MNRIVLIVCLSSLFTALVSCKKDYPLTTSLIGSWELRQSPGGMMAGANNYLQEMATS